MKFDLHESAKDHILVVAHRGVAGGNIPCNTLPAYETALKQGADMIETDLSRTADGHLVIFHPKMEPIHLRSDKRIPELTIDEVKELRYVNYDDTPTQFGIVMFDDFLEQFKGRCYINVDKFWGCPEDIYRAVKRHGMLDQILVKSALSEEVLSVLENVAPEIPFMPIVKEEHPMHKELMKRNINYVGVEVLFKNDDSVLASPEFMEMMHKDGKLVWVNSIIYNYRSQLSGGHSDDTALSESMEYGWGWLADRGFDLIQTDWTQMLVNFLKETGRYYKK
ncbi:MAG: glycerophosphodiester phosphodiesterase family protein [Clostridia bacterium]|nr:glycerophosphodiester phosphodiesterase family protein [Clostridia bacterium]